MLVAHVPFPGSAAYSHWIVMGDKSVYWLFESVNNRRTGIWGTCSLVANKSDFKPFQCHLKSPWPKFENLLKTDWKTNRVDQAIVKRLHRSIMSLCSKNLGLIKPGNLIQGLWNLLNQQINLSTPALQIFTQRSKPKDIKFSYGKDWRFVLSVTA